MKKKEKEIEVENNQDNQPDNVSENKNKSNEIDQEELTKEEQADSSLKEVNELKLEIGKISDKYARLNAEFMNYKKRTEKEKSDIYLYANEKLIVDLLPVIDNFDRAMNSINESSENSSLINGLNMIKKSMEDFLNKNNVVAIDTTSSTFDPHLHHAVMTEVDDEKEENEIIQEFQKGYKLNDKVIRHSMVKVNKK